MKKKIRFWSVIIGFGALIFSCFWFLKYSPPDEFKPVLESMGLLKSESIGIGYYQEAIQVLHESKWSDDIGNLDMISESIADRFFNAVTEGSKSRNLGMKAIWQGPYEFDFTDANGIKLKFEDLKMLIKAIEVLSDFECKKDHIDKSQKLALTNMALGVQLSKYDIDFVHLLGITAKDTGVRSFEKCLSKRDTQFPIEELSKAKNREFDKVRKTTKSFWNHLKMMAIYGLYSDFENK